MKQAVVGRFGIMGIKWSIEKSRSFSMPYEELFRSCERALMAMNLKITLMDELSGVIEAEKPAKWPFKSDRRISVTVRSDGRVKAVGKLDLGRRSLTDLSGDDLITEHFFQNMRDLL
jgi:hypothetical protein